jgi:glutamate N-acetyltransferase/amino-acid N-acetyltransferase
MCDLVFRPYRSTSAETAGFDRERYYGVSGSMAFVVSPVPAFQRRFVQAEPRFIQYHRKLAPARNLSYIRRGLLPPQRLYLQQRVEPALHESFRFLRDGSVTTPEGFRAAAMAAGLKPSGAPDLALLYSPLPCIAAGVFTQSVLAAAPVRFCRAQLAQADQRVQAILINSGQANAATGTAGDIDAQQTAEAVARSLKISPAAVLLASTGVIGKRIPMDLLLDAVPRIVELVSRADASSIGGTLAARAIMTTDLVPKHIAGEAFMPDGRRIRVGAMAKGSGMIHPNMATMLAFATTDAEMKSTTWQKLLRNAADQSFNQITVDGDTSTNDTLLGLANGAAGVSIPDDERSIEYRVIRDLLTAVLQHCAKAIARDGEGANVLLEVRVSGARSDAEARQLARCVASSALCKAAVFGKDPNWGRVAAALGRAGVPFDPMHLEIALGPHQLMTAGQPVPYDAEAARRYLADAAAAGKNAETYNTAADTVTFEIRVGQGPGMGLAWGCDLSYDYVRINAEYTT